MSSAARSLLVFGIYVVSAGLALVLAPHLVLRLLGFPPAPDGWVRVAGVLSFFIGCYHIVGALYHLEAYIRATVYARIALAVVFGAFVVLRVMPAPLLLFGIVDLLGAAWTSYALRAQSGRAAPVG